MKKYCLCGCGYLTGNRNGLVLGHRAPGSAPADLTPPVATNRSRLRTLHDGKALRGEAPWVPGGNPTPEEVRRQEAYDRATGRTGWPLVDLARNPDPGEYADMASSPEGGIMPGVLAARGDRGWGADADRDSKLASALAGHVRHLDDLADRWERGEGEFGQAHPDQSVFVDALNDFAGTWQSIRKITRSEGGE